MKILVAHAAWIPERRESLKRLVAQLGEAPMISASSGPEHASIWARRAWEWAAQQDEHVLILNDDVLVHPEIRKICEAMIEAVPDECLSLHTNFLAAAVEAAKGHHWVRAYMYTGPAVILPPVRARSLVDWVHRMPWGFLSRMNEDNAAIHWAWAEQRPFWAAVPAPVGHDTTVRSTLGYDEHPFRVPTVPWGNIQWSRAELTSADWWRVGSPPPCVGNPWLPEGVLEYVRRVHAEGGQLCVFCRARQGVVGTQDEAGPRACFTCAAAMYQAAVQAGRGGRHGDLELLA